MKSFSSILLSWLHFIFLLTFPPFSSAAANFLHASNITLYGDASYQDRSVTLTAGSLYSCAAVTASSPSMGRALFSYPIRFLDSSTNSSAASFLSRFSFLIAPSSPPCSAGDGLAFLITSDPDSFSLSDGYMGLPAPAFQVQDSSYVAVEFDTRYDPKFGDINDNHIGIDLSSVTSAVSVDAASQGVDLAAGKKVRAWVEYRDSVKLIRIWVGHSGTRPARPALSAQIDLSKYFREFMHVGFSASNGLGSAAHVVSHWRFKAIGYGSGSIPTDRYYNLGEENCLMCFPEDLSIEMGDGRDRPNYSRDLFLGFGGLASLLCSLVLIFGFITYCIIARKRKSSTKIELQEKEWNCSVQFNKVPARLSLSSIRAATLGFSTNQIIGEGASATVYQGTLPSGRTIAVKRFDHENRLENCRSPFTTEFATMVGYLRHKNLVQLQGWCCEGSELLLVYEYLPNGSLDKVLHNRTESLGLLLSWAQRKKIVLGVAAALTYLHEECERQIIHRDVKSCNILLDQEFNAKLGDFGLAEVYEHSCHTRAVTIPAGTMGYLAPEYVYHSIPSVKTDVYSFGVVVLEVATGRRAVEGGGRKILVDWVWDLWEKGLIIEDAVDCKLRGKCYEAEVERMLIVGLCCVHPNPEKRPSVKEVARMLKGEAPIPRMPRAKPRVRIGLSLPEKSEGKSSSAGETSPGGNIDVAYMTPKTHFGYCCSVCSLVEMSFN